MRQRAAVYATANCPPAARHRVPLCTRRSRGFCLVCLKSGLLQHESCRPTLAPPAQLEGKENRLTIHVNLSLKGMRSASVAGLKQRSLMVYTNSGPQLLSSQVKVANPVIGGRSPPHPPLGIGKKFPHRDLRMRKWIFDHMTSLGIQTPNQIHIG